MALAKEERNRRFINDWKVDGLSNEELAQEYKMTIGGVKALKQRLRQKHPSLYEKGPASKPAIQQSDKTSPEKEEGREPVIQQTSKLAEYKKVTYYLDPEMVKAIKRQAVEKEKDISALIREVLSEYLTKRRIN